jgi:hypothetical protein
MIAVAIKVWPQLRYSFSSLKQNHILLANFVLNFKSKATLEHYHELYVIENPIASTNSEVRVYPKKQPTLPGCKLCPVFVVKLQYSSHNNSNLILLVLGSYWLPISVFENTVPLKTLASSE